MFCQTCNTLGLTDALALTRCRTPKSIVRLKGDKEIGDKINKIIARWPVGAPVSVA
jgi:hypothetical protein